MLLARQPWPAQRPRLLKHPPNCPCLQVPHNGQHLSCCTVVRGMQRNLFVVPREPVGSEEIAELEAAAASDPAAKKKLIPLLHVSGQGGRVWERGRLR